MGFTRFIAMGDSLTEGLSDRYPAGNYRGWADRVADVLASQNADFKYANLAVRGKLINQVIADQIPAAISFVVPNQTILSFHAGANDLLRPKLILPEILESYVSAIEQIAKLDVKLLLFTVREITSPKSKIEELWNLRFMPFNENVKNTAREHQATVLDANSAQVFGDPRMLAKDRLHLSSEGHRRVAAAVLNELNLPHDSDWRDPLPPAKVTPKVIQLGINALWAVAFVIPWVIRRLTGKSSGDSRVAKYPTPINWPIDTLN